MLKAHGEVRTRIEAYAEGKEVAVARAQAIRDALVKAYAVDTARLQTEGYKGKSGEQRVELVQL
jgi:flagellar motor protein MotB